MERSNLFFRGRKRGGIYDTDFDDFVSNCGVVLIVGTLISLIMAVSTYLKYPSKSLVTCSETGKAAAVHMDAGKAARDVLQGKHVRIHLNQCSCLPERVYCGQESQSA
jgi:hypothetical protein